MFSLLKTLFYGIYMAHLSKLTAMKICPKMQEYSHNATNLSVAIFPMLFVPVFDISHNIHENAIEMSFILTHGNNVFVIYGFTGVQ